MVNNEFSSFQHLHGDYSDPDKPLPGLFNQLAKRVGMLSRLVKLLPTERFRMLINGLFMSKMVYSIQLFSNSWGTETRNETETRHNAFMKSNMLTLQLYQNKVLRLLTRNGFNVSTKELCNQGGFLSINQIVAHTTLMSFYKIKKTGKPKYLSERLGFNRGSIEKFSRHQSQF